MAVVLKSFDFSKLSQLTSHEDRKNYPWEDWFDGRIWKLTEGKDFQAHPLMMERIIRTRASTDKAKLQLRHVARGNGSDDPWGFIILQNKAGGQYIEAAPKPEKATKKAAPKKAPAKKAAAKKPSPPTKKPAKPTKRLKK